MRISTLEIGQWRNLTDVTAEVSTDASLISLVGSNGTGKTNVLELLSFASSRFGLSAGVRSSPRQAPPANAELRVVLAVNESFDVPADILRNHLGQGVDVEALKQQWDRTLTLWCLPTPVAEPRREEMLGLTLGAVGEVLSAGGILEPYSEAVARAAVSSIGQRGALNHLFLDADRTYEQLVPADQEVLAASREDQTAPGVLTALRDYVAELRTEA